MQRAGGPPFRFFFLKTPPNQTLRMPHRGTGAPGCPLGRAGPRSFIAKWMGKNKLPTIALKGRAWVPGCSPGRVGPSRRRPTLPAVHPKNKSPPICRELPPFPLRLFHTHSITQRTVQKAVCAFLIPMGPSPQYAGAEQKKGTAFLSALIPEELHKLSNITSRKSILGPPRSKARLSDVSKVDYCAGGAGVFPPWKTCRLISGQNSFANIAAASIPISSPHSVPVLAKLRSRDG